ncbi:MAG: hypothetical protein IT260_18460 [Saprospiraceae bacterium]|nr:hypothetical protein [Saprospiraceae bacterium]
MERPPLSVFGIRHHGPGSARSLLHALDALQPDLILLEGPPEGEPLLPPVAAPDMVPPVALLIYNAKNLRQASFFPFAEFSPEWQAMLFGLRQGVPLRFMDLPMSITFALRDTDEEAPQLQLNLPDPDAPAALPDPFTAIARLAGYSDPERWWEAIFERKPDPAAVFPVVLELMQALRAEKARGGTLESRETLLREAFMRQTIRAAQKEGFRRIAVVCGAWHAPVLHDTPRIKAAEDATVLKGLKKIKTQATWVPWSFDRLATQSGYGAGVVAPAWYRELWAASAMPVAENDPSAEIRFRAPHAVWLARAARLLREQDLILSSAHVIEAVRLAETLAALRHTLLPGIEELREAAVTVLCEGAEKPLELLERQLVVGDVLGRVPASVQMVPLKIDFEAQLRSARLQLSTEEQSLALDLREASHLRKSQLLHRLQVLRIPWGTAVEGSGREQGRFHENWSLKWLPDYEIRLIEAGTWGNTVEEAALRRIQWALRQQKGLPELVQLLSAVLKAELTPALAPLVQQIRRVSALARDALLLADTVLPLVEVLRYGHARQMDLSAIRQLLEQVVPRVCIQLPGACQGIQADVAEEVAKKVLAVHRALGIWQQPEHTQAWQEALAHMADFAAPLLAGLACRLLFEQKILDTGAVAGLMHYRLSHGQATLEAALWLDGFLQGSGLLLIHQPALWQLLDAWVGGIPEADFPELLPVLRRTFSRFAGPEREKMLDLAKNGPQTSGMAATENAGWDEERVALLRPLLALVLR